MLDWFQSTSEPMRDSTDSRWPPLCRMSRGPSRFRQRDVTAAVKAVVAAGVEVARVEVEKDGKIIVITGKPADGTPNGEVNEWDAVHR